MHLLPPFVEARDGPTCASAGLQGRGRPIVDNGDLVPADDEPPRLLVQPRCRIHLPAPHARSCTAAAARRPLATAARQICGVRNGGIWGGNWAEADLAQSGADYGETVALPDAQLEEALVEDVALSRLNEKRTRMLTGGGGVRTEIYPTRGQGHAERT
jgi:hypothetical protein